eukprot:403357071
MKKAFVTTLLASGLVLVSETYKYVPAGKAALKFNRFNGLSDHVYTEGYHFKLPLIETFKEYDIKPSPTQNHMETTTLDNKQVRLEMRFIIRPDVKNLKKLQMYIGPNYSETLMPPLFNEVAKNLLQDSTEKELIAQRQDVCYKIDKEMRQRMSQFHVELLDSNIVSLEFDDHREKLIK